MLQKILNFDNKVSWVNHLPYENDALIKEYSNFFANNFSRIKIDKVAVLNKNKFLTGIKIDNELLREYFRNYV